MHQPHAAEHTGTGMAPAAPSCGACGAAGLEPFYEQAGVPVNSCFLLSSREDALAYPKGDIRLALCRSCGFVQNDRHDPALTVYGSAYEETQGFSPRFRTFLVEMVDRLIRRYGIRGRRALEIGCGKGEFLQALCARGANRGLGFDPAYRADRARPDPAVRFEASYFGEAQLPLVREHDVLVCRHTLEHLARPGAFIRTLRDAAADREDLLFHVEVPCGERVLRDLAFWDVYYEHVGYFDQPSLRAMFLHAGLEVRAEEKVYGGQYLIIDASPKSGRASLEAEPHHVATARRERVMRFAEEAPARIERWRERLLQRADRSKRIAVWGSGSKAVAFLGALGDAASAVAAVTDVNPHRHGRYLPGSGRQIVPPALLKKLRPHVVVAMNAIYRAEIAKDLSRMGLSPELIALDEA